jgi:ribosomal protein L19E
MAAHLARHLSSHGLKKKKKTVKKAKRAPKTRISKKAGRPKGVGTRFGLKKMSLERLTELIDAARHEARGRLTEIEASIG